MKNMESVAETSSENSAEIQPEAQDKPKKTRVWLKRIFKFLLVCAALLVLVVGFCLGPIAKTAVNKFGAEMLGVDKMSVDSIAIYPFGGYVRIENFVIGKPTESGTDFSRDLFSLEYFEFDFDVSTALSQKKVIDRIELKNLSLNYEKNAPAASNIEVIAKRFIKDDADKPEPPEPEDEPDSDGDPIYLAARYVDIQNIRVNAYFNGIPSPIPPISFEFKDGLGLDENLTPMQFGLRFAGNFASVFRMLRGTIIGDLTGMTADAISSAAGFTVNAVSDAAKGTASVVTDVAGVTADVAGATVGVVGDAAGATTEAVTDTAKKIFDIFSSDKKEDSENKE